MRKIINFPGPVNARFDDHEMPNLDEVGTSNNEVLIKQTLLQALI